MSHIALPPTAPALPPAARRAEIAAGFVDRFRDRTVLWQEVDPDPATCCAAAHELRKLAEALRYRVGSRTTVADSLNNLRRSLRSFVSGGGQAQARPSYVADPRLFAEQRVTMLETCLRELGVLAAHCEITLPPDLIAAGQLAMTAGASNAGAGVQAPTGDGAAPGADHRCA